MVAPGSTTFNLFPLAVTLTLSRDTTATCENSAPLGFQHFVQPQTWLWALCAVTDTATLPSKHLQYAVPPEKFAARGWMRCSPAGRIAGIAIVSCLLERK